MLSSYPQTLHPVVSSLISIPSLFLLRFFFLCTLLLLGLLFLSRTRIRRAAMESEFPNKALTNTRFSLSPITLWLRLLHPCPSRHHSFALQLQGRHHQPCHRFLQNPSFFCSSCRDSMSLLFSSQASPSSCVLLLFLWTMQVMQKKCLVYRWLMFQIHENTLFLVLRN